MATQLFCEGTEELFQKIEENKAAPNIFVLCTGNEDPVTGQSWCPDCVKADPVIEKCVKHMRPKDVFILCTVGDKPTWKDPTCAFRTHPKLQLKSIPTLIKWNTANRLSEDDCANEDLVAMLFEE